jgi:hypothetical protein
VTRREFLTTGVLFLFFSVTLYVYGRGPFELSFGHSWTWQGPDWLSNIHNTIAVLLCALSAIVAVLCLVGAFRPESVNRLLDFLEGHASWRKIRPYFGLLYFFAFLVSFFRSFVEGLAGVAGQVPLFILLFGIGLAWMAAIILTFAVKPRVEGGTGERKQHAMKVKSIGKRKRNLLLFIAIGLAVGALDFLFWCIFSNVPHVPVLLSSLYGFMPTLWQVHAALVGFTVVVVTVVVTVVANERERTRTWGLYMGHSRFLLIVWFNLWAIVNEGIVTLLLSESPDSFMVAPRVTGLVVSVSTLFLVSVFSAAWLYWVTTRFIDESYVEDLAERRIINMIPNEVDRQLNRLITNARHLHDGQG